MIISYLLVVNLQKYNFTFSYLKVQNEFNIYKKIFKSILIISRNV